MNLKKILLKVSNYIAGKQGNVFSLDVVEQKKYVNHFKNPNSNLERSYYQYKCQMKFYNPILFFFINISALPLIILHLYKYKRNSFTPKDKRRVVFATKIFKNKSLPSDLLKAYPEMQVEYDGSECLTDKDIKFVKAIYKKYPFSFLFILKIMIRLANYSYNINTYSPEIIICSSEYSYTSSILTEYCNLNGVKHVNIMHGEKLYFMRDSFFKYDKCYVWDEHYKNLFIDLRADKNQFVYFDVYTDNLQQYENKIYDYTYYLQDETLSELKNIKNSLDKLKAKGFRIAVRPHPIYSNKNVINNLFSDYTIENKDVHIEKSIMITNNVISLYSTVLNQAYKNNVTIIIDDISNNKKYEKLKSLNYIIINKEHMLLSGIL